jgi:hypothetical protein
MEKIMNERFIVFAGSKAGGSQRLPIPPNLEIEENKDIVVSIDGYAVVYNCIKEEFFNNQDGTWNVVYLLKQTVVHYLKREPIWQLGWICLCRRGPIDRRLSTR